jgi:hypothetical protein
LSVTNLTCWHYACSSRLQPPTLIALVFRYFYSSRRLRVERRKERILRLLWLNCHFPLFSLLFFRVLLYLMTFRCFKHNTPTHLIELLILICFIIFNSASPISFSHLLCYVLLIRSRPDMQVTSSCSVRSNIQLLNREGIRWTCLPVSLR